MKWWKTGTEATSMLDVSALDVDGLLSLTRSHDGYAREAAVVEWVRRGDPQAIGPLLVRAGDWVPEVRRAAQLGLGSLMRDEFATQWARALPELAFARRIGRTNLRELLVAIEAFLARNIDALERHAQSPDRAALRWMFTLRLGQTHDEASRLALLKRGLRSDDLPTSQRCLEAVGRLPTPSQRWSMFEVALRSRLPGIRASAMRELLGTADFDTRTMCFDRSAVVRSLALGALSGEGRQEIIDRATQLLQSPASGSGLRVAALHVLSLLEASLALALARGLLASPMVMLRHQAHRLVLRAEKDDGVDAQLLEILVDTSPKVRRLAAEHVRRERTLPDPETLIALGLARRELARDVMAMFGRGSPWDRLLFVLELLNAGDLSDDLAFAVTNELRAWVAAMANCYVGPQARQSERLASLWKERAALLPAGRPKGLLPFGFPEEIEYHLRVFRVV